MRCNIILYKFESAFDAPTDKIIGTQNLNAVEKPR
jgi:hypothetical protein